MSPARFTAPSPTKGRWRAHRMKQNSTESVNLAPKRNPNPLPEVDSRWIAHDRRGEIVVVDKILFDQEMRENRIWYHEERTGYRGSTWQSRFRKRKAFTAVSEPTPTVAAVEVLPVQTVSAEPEPSPAPEPEHGPPCIECGAPCQMRRGGGGGGRPGTRRGGGGKKWRTTCSPECLWRYRSRQMEKGRSPVTKSRNPEVGPPCVECGAPSKRRLGGTGGPRWRTTCSLECLAKIRHKNLGSRAKPSKSPPCSECGAPCQKWKNGSNRWRSTCSLKCLSECRARSGAVAKAKLDELRAHSEKQAPQPRSKIIDRTAAENKSVQLTLRYTPTEAVALARIAKKASSPGLEVSTSQAARMALVEGIRALDR